MRTTVHRKITKHNIEWRDYPTGPCHWLAGWPTGWVLDEPDFAEGPVRGVSSGTYVLRVYMRLRALHACRALQCVFLKHNMQTGRDRVG